MKKWRKIWLIVWGSLLVAWWAWAWLTKAWVIPNWFDIELLCPWNQIENYTTESYGCYDNPDYDPNYDCSQEFNYNDYNYFLCVDKHNRKQHCLKKPIIYLYPTTETEVNVKLWTPENLSHTYPKYNWEKWWNVIAQPNWDLEDMDTWRKLYALYWEWKNSIEANFDEWFVVKWEDIIPFLEEKLAILWLNERESEEFIIYWLPQMENNEYNLIRFETMEEQNENMPLNITPTPDTIIRVMMDWKAIDEPINIPEQKLETPERIWFTVVEWWGSPRN